MDRHDAKRLDFGRAFRVSELARASGVPARRIRAAISTGALPAMRVDSWARVWAEDFVAWCAEQTCVSASPTRETAIRERVGEQIRREAKTG